MNWHTARAMAIEIAAAANYDLTTAPADFHNGFCEQMQERLRKLEGQEWARIDKIKPPRNGAMVLLGRWLGAKFEIRQVRWMPDPNMAWRGWWCDARGDSIDDFSAYTHWREDIAYPELES